MLKKQIVRWWVPNLIFAGIAYQGLITKNEFCQNLLVFLTNIIGVISLLFLLGVRLSKTTERPLLKISVPLALEYSYNMLCAIVFAAEGWWWCATIWLVHGAIIYATTSKTTKI